MTLKDIAEMAGVSTMPVSNVINGKTSRVSQKTRDKINSIIEEYNYVPNMNARSLSNNSSHIIGVVTFLEDKDYASGYNYFENPYVSTMIGTIETELHKNGYFTMLQSVSRSSDILSLVKQRAYVLKDGFMKFKWEEYRNSRSQDLEPFFHDAGQFYCYNIKDYLACNGVITDKIVPIELPELEVQDIDNEQDWIIAEMKYKLMKGETKCQNI